MYLETDILLNDDERLLKVRDLIEEWEHLKALRLIEEVLDHEALCEEAFYLRGYIFENRYGKFDEALSDYEIATRINPEYFEALAAHLRLLNTCDRHKDVLRIMKNRQISPSRFSQKIGLQLAVAYEKSGDFGNALEKLQETNRLATSQGIISQIEETKERVIRKMNEENNFFIWG